MKKTITCLKIAALALASFAVLPRAQAENLTDTAQPALAKSQYPWSMVIWRERHFATVAAAPAPAPAPEVVREPEVIRIPAITISAPWQTEPQPKQDFIATVNLDDLPSAGASDAAKQAKIAKLENTIAAQKAAALAATAPTINVDDLPVAQVEDISRWQAPKPELSTGSPAEPAPIELDEAPAKIELD